MKLSSQLIAALMCTCLAGQAMPAKPAANVTSNPVEKVAAVSDVVRTAEGKPCIPSARHDGNNEKFWNLKKDSEFDFRTVGNYRYNVSRISSNIDREIEEPVYIHVNDGGPWIAKPPCKGDPLTGHQFLFALQELEEPGHSESRSWHALIYVPVALQTGEYKFQLIVLSIENDSRKCDEMANEKKRKQCDALRKLAVLKMDNASFAKIRATMAAKIDEILPPTGFGVDGSKSEPVGIRYHNGVIHGALF